MKTLHRKISGNFKMDEFIMANSFTAAIIFLIALNPLSLFSKDIPEPKVYAKWDIDIETENDEKFVYRYTESMMLFAKTKWNTETGALKSMKIWIYDKKGKTVCDGITFLPPEYEGYSVATTALLGISRKNVILGFWMAKSADDLIYVINSYSIKNGSLVEIGRITTTTLPWAYLAKNKIYLTYDVRKGDDIIASCVDLYDIKLKKKSANLTIEKDAEGYVLTPKQNQNGISPVYWHSDEGNVHPLKNPRIITIFKM